MLHKSCFTDELVFAMYTRMVESRADRSVFYDGSCKSLSDFSNIMLAPDVHSWALFFEGELAGICWLNGLCGKSAHGHFCMFDNVYGRAADGVSKSVILGRFVTSSWLRHTDENGRHLLDVVIGITPKRNKLAVKWVQRCGAVRRCDIPYGVWFADEGVSEDAVLTTITRESTDDSWLSA